MSIQHRARQICAAKRQEYGMQSAKRPKHASGVVARARRATPSLTNLKLVSIACDFVTLAHLRVVAIDPVDVDAEERREAKLRCEMQPEPRARDL
eukprot:6195205-Pleurochrysis_carterae.AAC.1